MMKSELYSLLQDLHEDEGYIPNISDPDYRVIEMVYTYYPDIADKMTVARLYDEFGIRLFVDMYPRACRIRDLEVDMQAAKMEYDRLKTAYEEAIGTCDI